MRMTGQKLRRIRKLLGLTQVEFADLVCVTSNTIARQERGEVTIRGPFARLVELIAERETKSRAGENRSKGGR